MCRRCCWRTFPTGATIDRIDHFFAGWRSAAKSAISKHQRRLNCVTVGLSTYFTHIIWIFACCRRVKFCRCKNWGLVWPLVKRPQMAWLLLHVDQSCVLYVGKTLVFNIANAGQSERERGHSRCWGMSSFWTWRLVECRYQTIQYQSRGNESNVIIVGCTGCEVFQL